MTLDPTQRGMERALDAIVHAQMLGTLTRSSGARYADLATIRERLLPEGVGVLVYLPSLERTHVFAVDAHTIRHAPTVPRAAIVQANDDLASYLLTSPRGLSKEELAARRAGIARACGTLGAQLLPAEIRDLVATWHTVLVVGDELMGDVPFEVITWANDRALGLERGIGYLPSLPFCASLAALPRAVRSDLEFLLLAAPEFQSGAKEVRPINFTRDDERALLAPFAADAVCTLRASAARASALSAATPFHTRAVCVLTHGTYDATKQNDGERGAGLLLSAEADRPDGIVWCADVDRMHVAVYVELITCGSWRGPPRLGDDTGAHLGSAFLRAGARAVVLSPYDIAYEPSVRLIARAHERMRLHFESPAEAFRVARAELAADAETADPYYWGLIRVLGLAHEPVYDAQADPIAPRRSDRSVWIIAGCGVVLVAAGVVSVRARAKVSSSARGRARSRPA
jgi:hypothetical protein